jgi:hypothetical protein
MAALTRRKLKSGDILEVFLPAGIGYVQYVGTHAEYGDAVRVLSGHYASRVADLSGLLSDAGYLAFYPATAAVAEGLVSVAGSLPLPAGCGVPTHLRRAGARAPDGKILTWIIEKDGTDTVCRELTDAERQLPIASIWSHEGLTTRMSQGWSPDQLERPSVDRQSPGGANLSAGEQTCSDLKPEDQIVRHYLYFRFEKSAAHVARILSQSGFAVEYRLGGDDINWLVLVSTRMPQGEERLAESRAVLEAIAEENEGEYDGWEIEVKH